MGGQAIALGTDTNGIEASPGPPPYPMALQNTLPATGRRRWDYNSDGVAHYGLMPEFVSDLSSQSGGEELVKKLFGGARAFFQMWVLSAHNPITGNPIGICQALHGEGYQPPDEVCDVDEWIPSKRTCERRPARDGTLCGGNRRCRSGNCGCQPSNRPCETTAWNGTACVQKQAAQGTPCGNGRVCFEGECACPPSDRPCEYTMEWNGSACQQKQVPEGTPCN
jgi:hypothetical protein